MKRWLVLIVVLVVWVKPLQAQSVSGGVNDFQIESFRAEYRLSRDNRRVGQMAVKETIVAQFPDIDQNHGILRALPQTYGDYDLGVKVSTIEDEGGRPYPFTTYTQNGNLVLKIGDPDTYVHGRTAYVIDYSLSNVITFFDDHDELFWDVNGDQWSQPFGMVQAVLHIPDELAGQLKDEQLCYSGVYGSTNQNCQIVRTITHDGLDVSVSAQDLAPGENLSFVLGFSPHSFFEDPWPARKRLLQAASAVIPPVVLLWYTISRWRRYGRDPAGRGVIVPQYTPPEGINPLSADVILNESLRTQAISAAIVELAVSGYIKIIEQEKKKLIGSSSEYTLVLVKDASQLPASMQDVVGGLFSSVSAVGEQIKINDKANKLYATATKLNKDVPNGLWKRHYFAVDPNKARTRWVGRTVVLFLIGFGLIFLDITRWFGVGVLGSSIIMMFFAGVMPARTKEGVAAKEHLLGLKDYIKLAETDRIKFLQSPEGVKQYGDPTQPQNQLKLFEKLLPYAMLFGLEKDWAKQFANLYTQPPEWFSSYHGNFTPIILANSLSSFTSTTTTAFSPPSSSGSSGFSGGGSGGGGGGGGGGGW